MPSPPLHPTRAQRLALIAALALGGACDRDRLPGADPEEPRPGDPSGLVGTWRLDAATRAWLPRACVRLDFPDPAQATFDIEEAGDELVVRLNTPHRTAWRVRFHGTSIAGQQILPTTPSGRFCGRETLVGLRLHESSPGVLMGVWKTPGCDVCPDRPFGATRAGARTLGPPLFR